MRRAFAAVRRSVPAPAGSNAAPQRGFTLIEVLVGVALTGIVMVPLSMAMVVGYRTVFGAQQKLTSASEAQLIASTFPADVQSAGGTGVNPTDPVNENTCAAKPEDGETPLIMFVWDEDLGVNNQSVARYIAKGSGADSEIIRRYCKGNADAEDTIVARRFGTSGSLLDARLFLLGADGKPTPQCDATSCFIQIDGAYKLRLDVDRRVPGAAPGALVPDTPTNVHAIGGNNRVTVYWTDPADNGAPITGYYLEQMPGGTVLGPFSTTGTGGAQVNGLANGQSYTFRVRAANVLGPGPYSDPTGAVTPGPTTPDALTITAVAADPAMNGRATVSWSTPSGYNDGGAAVVGYKVYAVHAPSEPVVLSVSDPSATTAQVTGLSDNTQYAFQVSARNTYGEGTSSALSAQVLTLPGAPGQPAASNTQGTVQLRFSPPSGDFANLTRVRAHVLETGTITTPVAASTACPGASPTTCTLTVTGLASGQTYSVTVQAENATGWGPESAATGGIDLDPPGVIITNPSGAWVDSTTPVVSGTAGSATSDLPTVTVKVYSGATASGTPVATMTPSASAGAWSVATSPALNSGQQYTVVASQSDTTGNVGTSNPVTFSVDTGAPTGSLTAPSAGANVRGLVTVSSSSADTLSGVASVTFRASPAGANTWSTIGADSTSPWTMSWSSTSVADGQYDLRVVTTDTAGNTSTSSTVTVRVDNTNPTVNDPTVTGTQGTNGWYTGNVTVTWPAPTDAGSGIATTSGCGVTSITTNTTGQVVTCSATDNAGNNASNSVTIKRDNAVPSSATLNALGTYVANGKVLTGTGADATSGVGSITYLYCAGTSCTPSTVIGSSSVGGSYPVTWNGMPANGSYQVLGRVFDVAGNSLDSAKQTVTIDNTAPTGTIAAPAASANLHNTATVTSNSADASSGVQSATFQRSPSGAGTWTTIATDTVTPYTTSWDTTAVTDGLYDLRVVTQDNAGNTFTSGVVTVRVDNTAPTVGAPIVTGTLGNNGWYTSNVTVTWPAPTDAGAGIASSTGCGATSITTDTAGQVVTCSATDNAGNTNSNSVTIKRDTAAPTKTAMDMRDTDGDGRVDQVVLTFNETLDTYTAGTAPWTLANVPSAGSLGSVSASGTTATLNITEGAGAKDTSVGSFTVALAGNASGIRDAAGNRASFTASAPTDDAAPVPVTVTLSNKSGGTAGKLESGDFFTVTYSEAVSVSSLCTTWSGNASNQGPTNVTASVTNSSLDPITLGSPCANFGTLTPNVSYGSGAYTIPTSPVSWTVSTKALKVVFGTPSISMNTGIASTVPTYTPSTSIKDAANNPMTATDFDGTSGRF